MDSTPSNGSDRSARTRKANTTTATAGRPAAISEPSSTTNGRLRGDLPPLETYPAVAIEDVQPELDGGQWPIKRVVGDLVEVSADIFKEGHDLLQARVQYRALDDRLWHEQPMRLVENDRWV